jgi:hypothetical protein
MVSITSSRDCAICSFSFVPGALVPGAKMAAQDAARADRQSTCSFVLRASYAPIDMPPSTARTWPVM